MTTRAANWEPIPNRVPPRPDQVMVGVWADRRRQLTVIVSRDCGRWHLSISHPARYPSWDEIAEARSRFLPDEVYVMMPLPPRDIYVNVHKRCFHLWEAQEIKTCWLMEQM